MNTIGEQVKMMIFGQSHSEAIGMVLEGIPAGEDLDFGEIQAFMDRRRPGRNSLSTSRKESDTIHVLSGMAGNKTCGAPLAVMIENTDARSSDYDEIRKKPRPMHADYPSWVKTNGFRDYRGGGEYSGRLTAPLCFAGAVCLQLLRKRGIRVGAHIASIGGIQDIKWDPTSIAFPEEGTSFPTLSAEAGAKMIELIEKVQKEQDSIGGTIECAVTGVAAGLGDPMFDGIENRISRMIFGIPAVKGIEFGSSLFDSAIKGSEYNDPYEIRDGKILTATNHHGGILGGMTTGMPIVFRVSVKPTPSIGKIQKTVNLETMENTELEIKGRHDPCVVPRAVPVVEAATAVALMDILK